MAAWSKIRIITAFGQSQCLSSAFLAPRSCMSRDLQTFLRQKQYNYGNRLLSSCHTVLCHRSVEIFPSQRHFLQRSCMWRLTNHVVVGLQLSCVWGTASSSQKATLKYFSILSQTIPVPDMPALCLMVSVDVNHCVYLLTYLRSLAGHPFRKRTSTIILIANFVYKRFFRWFPSTSSHSYVHTSFRMTHVVHCADWRNAQWSESGFSDHVNVINWFQCSIKCNKLVLAFKSK